MTMDTFVPTSPAGKVLALAGAELRLLARNRTLAVSSLLLPLALGVFWAFSFGRDLSVWPMVGALQLSVTLGMGLYIAATQTLVARRHARVLKRMRTSGISDGGLVAATLAPAVAVGVVQLVVFAVVDAVIGAPAPVNPAALVLAAVCGIVLMVAAAIATSIVTPSPERGQITTLPLMFVLLGAAIVTAVVPMQGWLQALALVPGAGVGVLAQLAFGREADMGAVAATALGAASLLAWAAVFTLVAMPRFRWDPRNA